MRIITALILFVLFMLAWYTFVEYAPSLLQSQLQSIFGAFNQYIAAPSASTYWPYFLITAIAVVAGYVAHRER
jgi:Fe2+ transport system protein B